MSVPALQHDGSLRLAKEVTEGTAPGSATSKMEFVEWGFDPNLSTIPDTNMNSAGASPRAIGKGLQFVTGAVRWRVGYEGDEEMWRWALSTYSRTVFDSTASDHLYKEAKNGSPYTFEFDETFPTGKVTRFTGVRCMGLSLGISASGGDQGQLVATCPFAAGAVAQDTAPMGGTPAVTNLLPVYFHELLRTSGNIADGTGIAFGALYLSEFSLEIGTSHNTQRGYLGSVWADSPVRNGQLLARIAFEQQWDAATYVAMAALLGTTPPAPIKLIFRHPTAIGGTSAGFREFEIIASSPQSAQYVRPQGTFEVVKQAYGFQLAFNATDSSCIKIRKRNMAGALA